MAPCKVRINELARKLGRRRTTELVRDLLARDRVSVQVPIIRSSRGAPDARAMPHRDPPEPASPEALRALAESAEPELELIFFRFSIDAPAEKAEIVHACLVRLSLEWEGIEIDRKIWFLAEVEAECHRRTDLPPPPPRSEEDDLLP